MTLTCVALSLSIKKRLIAEKEQDPPGWVRLAMVPASNHVHSLHSGQTCALRHFCFNLRVKWQFYSY